MKQKYYSNLIVSITISNSNYEPIVQALNSDCGLEIGKFEVGSILFCSCSYKNINLSPGKYYVSLYVGTNDQQFEQIMYSMQFYLEQGTSFILRQQAYLSNFKTVLQSEWFYNQQSNN